MAHQYMSLNCPEENDETRSEEFESDITHNPNNHSTSVPQIILQYNAESYSSPYAHQTPYPSWDHHTGWPSSGSPHSLPSCLPSAIYHTLSESGSFFPSRPHSLPGSCSPSLEHPRSLHSFPPSAPSPSYPGAHLSPQCCGQYRLPQHHVSPIHYCSSRPGHQLPFRPSGAFLSVSTKI